MARTIEEIKKDITASFMRMEAVKSAYGLDGSKSFDECFSMASLENIIFYVFAVAVWSLEKLFDFHSADVDARIDRLEPHTLRWYTARAKLFMCGKTSKDRPAPDLVNDTDYYDLSDWSEAEIAEVRPVKYAVATESNTVIYIKVAREQEGKPKPLTPDQLDGLKLYMDEIKDAGVSVVIRNEQPDNMQIGLVIYYRSTLLTISDGEGVAADGSKPVNEAVKRVIENLPFNGMFRKSTLMAELQALECVEVADIDYVKAKPGNSNAWETVSGFIRPYSGYYCINPGDLKITYKPYNAVEDDIQN